MSTPADPARVKIPPYYPEHPVVRRDWAAYLNAVMVLDEKIGAVLSLLEQENLAERTIVIFMGDNGRAMVRGKQWPYDSGLHVPLIVYVPPAMGPVEGYRAHEISTELVSGIDVTATILSLAGVPIPETMQGQAFLGRFRQTPRRYVFGGRDRGDETVDRIRTVRSHRYRYLRNYYPERPFLQANRYKETSYPTIWVLRKLQAEGRLTGPPAQLMTPTRPREELYDLLKDPFEINNLVDSQSHQEILNQLRTALDDWLEASNDHGMHPEDPSVHEYYDQRARRMYDDRIDALRKEWGLNP